MADKRTILLVEDNPDDETLVLHALRDRRVADEVVVAHDGVEALDYLFASGSYQKRDGKDMPRLVLVDLKLPKTDGFEVLRRIRSDARTRLLPVVVLTSSREDEDVLRGYRLGANSYIRKAVDFTELMDAVQQVGRYWLNLNESPVP